MDKLIVVKLDIYAQDGRELHSEQHTLSSTDMSLDQTVKEVKNIFPDAVRIKIDIAI